MASKGTVVHGLGNRNGQRREKAECRGGKRTKGDAPKWPYTHPDCKGVLESWLQAVVDNYDTRSLENRSVEEMEEATDEIIEGIVADLNCDIRLMVTDVDDLEIDLDRPMSED